MYLLGGHSFCSPNILYSVRQHPFLDEPEEVAAPVKRKSKKAAAPVKDEDIADIVGLWGDED